jgi:hypothetical protein
MGKLKGYLPIEGTVGELSFVKTEDGIIVKQKSSISKEKIRNGKSFVLTRQNADEFGRAGKAAGLLYSALRSEKKNADAKAISRLVKGLMAALKADGVSARGDRTVQDGNPELLKGFQFNRYASVESVLKAACTPSINRVSGALTVTVDPFTPLDDLDYPEEASHYSITVLGAELDFAAGSAVTDVAGTGVLPINATLTSTSTLTAQLPAASTGTLLLALSITFYQSTNGTMERMRNKEHKALAILDVDHV